MAYPNSLLLLALLISAASLAHGAILNGVQIAGLNAAGRLVCTVGGTGNNSQGLPNLADGVIFDTSVCVASVNLTNVNCNVFPPTGNLNASLTLLNIVQNTLGAIANFLVGGFVVAA
ncbi:hypothetical protein CJ030_MR4G020934 [Morella rubra]|uniref:Phylloplanin n=1 Tax=Morella rubra TaxID=262757 RepID=A0A6A1VZT5_9ROSI|nr:hypothetical protein CJ030_MR4G020934 [Morella rubra]